MHQWSDVFIPPAQCWATLPLFPALLVTAAVIGLLIQILRAGMRLQRFWETRLFCTYILNMPSSITGLADTTWVDVQKRLIQSQQSTSIDELAVYHRILRHENYLIAMADQDVLPIRFSLPVTNPHWNYVFLPESYLYNLKLLLFWSPWSPFSHSWQLQTEYKEITRRHELAAHLGKMSRVLGLLNLLFAPVILLAQLLVFICSNAERLRYHPSSILGRRWSNYAHLYLRHYNELPHQFIVRVGLAYQPACQYLDSFVSRSLISVAETVAFVLGSASFAFFVLGLVHDQVIHLPGYWAILVIGGLLARACLSYIPDEHVVYSPETLLVTILGKIHRVRDDWIEHGATSRVRHEFAQLFQYRFCAAMEDLISAIVTPFLLIFVVPQHALEMVDFLRNYTVELKDLGDVCSFAQLDVRRHGDPQWRFFDGPGDNPEDSDNHTGGVDRGVITDDENGAFGPFRSGSHGIRHKSEEPFESGSQSDSRQLIGTWGKTELSLMYFHLNNPDCPLPAASRAYLQAIRRQLLRDMQQPALDSANATRLLSSLYGQPSVLSTNVTQPGTSIVETTHGTAGLISPIASSLCRPSVQLKNVSHLPGPSFISGNNLGFVGAIAESMRNSLHHSDPGQLRSTVSDINRTDEATPGSLSQGQNTPTGAPEAKGALTERDFRSAVPMYPNMLIPTTDPINMSVMAASALVSCNGSSTHPSYRPYTSFMENGSSLHFGLGTSAFVGNSSAPHGLTDVLTADTSASILYMHELAHRRRLQQSTGASGFTASQSRTMDRSFVGAFAGDTYHSGAFTPYDYGTNGNNSAVMGGMGSLNRPYQTTVYPSSQSRFPSDRTIRPTYGSMQPHAEPVGVVRSSLDTRRIVRPRVAEVTEEEDEIAGTPSHSIGTEAAYRAFSFSKDDIIPAVGRHSSSTGPPGVITVLGSPSMRSNLHRGTVPSPLGASNATPTAPGPIATTDPDYISPVLTDDTVSDHVWPDLPPTNC